MWDFSEVLQLIGKLTISLISHAITDFLLNTCATFQEHFILQFVKEENKENYKKERDVSQEKEWKRKLFETESST